MKLSPVKAIRSNCWACMGGEWHDNGNMVKSKEVNELINGCPSVDTCSLYEYRLGAKPKYPRLTPLKAMRAQCLDCLDNSSEEVKACKGDMLSLPDCFLHPYRQGRNPSLAGRDTSSATAAASSAGTLFKPGRKQHGAGGE